MLAIELISHMILVVFPLLIISLIIMNITSLYIHGNELNYVFNPFDIGEGLHKILRVYGFETSSSSKVDIGEGTLFYFLNKIRFCSYNDENN